MSGTFELNGVKYSTDDFCGPKRPLPIDRYTADLAKLLEVHPAPWEIDSDPKSLEAFVIDRSTEMVVAFDPNDVRAKLYWEGLAAAVNIAAGIRGHE